MKVVIIGGVAVGATAAARLRRLDEKAEIVLLERGPFVSFANCGLPYHVGGEISRRDALILQTPDSLKDRYDIDARIRHEALSIDRAEKTVEVRDLSSGKTYTETYDRLILGVGARPFIPPIPGIDSPLVFTVWTIPDVDRIKTRLAAGARGRAIVAGSGFVGLEMVENLARLGFEVVLVEKVPRLFPPADPDIAAVLHSTLLRNGVIVKTGTGVASFSEKDGGISAVLETGDVVDASLAVWAAGTVPNTEFLKPSGIEMNERGFIKVDAHLHTSDESIYAGGDSVTTLDRSLGVYRPIPLAAPANKQGRVIADNIVKGDTREYPGSFGSYVLRVMGLTIAGTGATSEALARAGTAHRCTIIHPASHATYFPGASSLTLKMVYGVDGKILGAQAAGAEAADKAIDSISMAMQGGLTVYDLVDFDHVYAPPYSSAKSPVNMAGFVAENDLEGIARFAEWKDLKRVMEDGAFLLDVRTPREHAAGAVAGATNIPVDDLRARLGELPRGKRIVLYCQSGLRNYVASRILAGNGFDDVVNMAGGYTMYAYQKAAYGERFP